MTIFGDGEQQRAFSYIDDVAPLIARGPLLSAARNQVFNVGADEPHSLNTLAAAVYDAVRSQGMLSTAAAEPTATMSEGKRAAAAAPDEAPVRYLDKRVEVDAAFSDHSKLRCFFQPPAPVPLAEGLQRMVAWLHTATSGSNGGGGRGSAARAIAPSRINAVEVRKNLPPSWVRWRKRIPHYIILRRFILVLNRQANILPRQARDIHRKS
jgi:UDP-glucose 4-epimerase